MKLHRQNIFWVERSGLIQYKDVSTTCSETDNCLSLDIQINSYGILKLNNKVLSKFSSQTRHYRKFYNYLVRTFFTRIVRVAHFEKLWVFELGV